MGQGLNLTPQQKAQMTGIATDMQKQMQTTFQNPGMSREQRMQQMRQARNQSVQKMIATLTPEQKEQMGKRRNGEGWRPEGRGGRGRRPGGPPPGGPPPGGGR